YGHGIARAFESLRAADGYALLDLDEAERIRALGWRGPILLLEGCFEPRDLELCSRLDLWHTVHCEAQIDWLAQHKTHRPHRVFLKLNSGMNRLGFAPQSYRGAFARLDALPQVDEISFMTHFSDADTQDGIAGQLAVFDDATRDLAGERTLSNSAATLRHGGDPLAVTPQVRNDWIRAGIMMYGSAPDFPARTIADWRLRPAMTLRSRLIGVQSLMPGDTVGYGSTYTAQQAHRIGVVACGYADGYPRSAPTGTPVLVDGVRTRMVGRVSMDMITVDLTPVPDAGLGSEVTLWGVGPAAPGGGPRPVLAIDEVARQAGTIGYELMCAVAPRVPIAAAPSGL
ncbi:MAG TPA: alanine racemase, partial [Burkholderiaceae bacterium]|nr:alanine racemase [Burkholderiaceae bacterium]